MSKTGELNGFLDEGCLIEGTITFQETLRADGKIKGSIVSKKNLIVGPTGEVEGEINVGTLQISGMVIGNVKASGKIVIHKGGRLFADVDTHSLVIEEGAVFQGKCTMSENREAEITPIREQKQGK